MSESSRRRKLNRLVSSLDVSPEAGTYDEIVEMNDRARSREARAALPRLVVDEAAAAAEQAAQADALAGSHEQRRAALDAIRAAARSAPGPVAATAPATASPVTGAPPAGWYTGPTGERWLWDGSTWIASARP